MKNLSQSIARALDTMIDGIAMDIATVHTVHDPELLKDFVGFRAEVFQKGGSKLRGLISRAEEHSLVLENTVVKRDKERTKETTYRKVQWTKIRRARVWPDEASVLKDEKMLSAIKSKVEGFKSSLAMLNRWLKSPNKPGKQRTKDYVKRLHAAGTKALFFLNRALGAEIDYDVLDPAKHHLAMQAKPLLMAAVMDLSAGLDELDQKLQVEDFNFDEVEFKEGYPERYARGEFFSVKGYYKDWLDTERDAVKICPKGTEGEMLLIDELNIVLPAVPRDKKKILFHDKPKSEQFWRRPTPSAEITQDNIDGFEEYIMEEFRRRREGIWFMNNGEPTYLTGNFYFALTYGLMLDNRDYMDFRKAQLRMSYHIEACLVDKRCFGQIMLKSRRTGFTYLALFTKLNIATGMNNGKFGMTSKTEDDVVEVWEKLIYAFLNLPFYFRPVVRGKMDSGQSLYFGKPSDNTKAAKKRADLGVDKYLNTVMDWRATSNGAYDSVKLNGYIGDECVAPDTLVLMADTTWKRAGDVAVGDEVMSGDGTGRKVLEIGAGVDDMYRVHEPYGYDYEVNSSHRLLFERGQSHSRNKRVTMTAPEYLAQSDNLKRLTRRCTFDGYPGQEREYPVDPYHLGLWLGDGTSSNTMLTINQDKDLEIAQWLKGHCAQRGWELKLREANPNWSKWTIKGGARGVLMEIGVLGNKHIPQSYFQGSRVQRLDLLAGIIDTDGHLAAGGGHQIGMARLELVEQIRQLAVGLGLDVSNVTEKETNFGTKAYRVSITDYRGEIPCKVARKRRAPTKKVARRGKVDVSYVGPGKYVGFKIEANSLGENTWVTKSGSLTNNCGKWISRVGDYIVHLGTVRPTMAPNGRVVGKALLGSTMGKHSEGGEQMITLLEGSRPSQRNPVTKKTGTWLYYHFLPAQENMEEFTDVYGHCWTHDPPKGTKNVFGDPIEIGSVEYLIAQEDEARKQGDKTLNTQYRTHPRSMEMAMRDESNACLFNITKLHEQLDNNANIPQNDRYMVGNFEWADDIDGDVRFVQNDYGRFRVAWLPSAVTDTKHLANAVTEKRGKFYPNNGDLMRAGCDPYSLMTTHGKGSKGGMHIKTMGIAAAGVPSNEFVVEYLSRPPDEYIFFEDVIKCIRYYGCPILVESNRIDLLRHMQARGYRPFAMNRLDRPEHRLNDNERKYGGQPMSGKDMLDSHINAIGQYINDYVGIYLDQEREVREIGEVGCMPFEETLNDWLKFDPKQRTEHDATISSGLAIMACQTERYKLRQTKKPTRNIGNFVPRHEGKRKRGSIVLNRLDIQ